MMDKLSNREQEMGVTAVSLAKQARMKEEMKIINKLLSPIKRDYCHNQYLSMLTRDDLGEIRRRLQVKGASSLKKDQLVELLSIEIKNNIEDIMYRLSEKEYDLLSNLVQKDGVAKCNVKDEYQRARLINLRHWGIVFTGNLEDIESAAVVPVDILNDINEKLNDLGLVSKIKQRHKLVRAIIGLLYYYGVVEENELHRLVGKLLNWEMDFDEFKAIVDDTVNFGKTIKRTGNLIFYSEVFDPQAIYEEQLKRRDIDYAQLTLDEVLEAGAEGFKLWTEYDKKLFNYIYRKYDITMEQAEEFVDGCIYLNKNNYNFNQVMSFVQRTFVITDLQTLREVSELVQEANNNARLWILKGHTPLELLSRTRSITNKVGRNDPCPCGSGIKYKKCCGKVS
jgi:hypothetical protein